MAAQWAADIQSVIDTGATTRGVPSVVQIDLTDVSETAIAATLCLDSSDVETTLPNGSSAEPAELDVWSASLVREHVEAPLLLETLEPVVGEPPCDP